MSRQLSDLIPPFSTLSYEEKLRIIQRVRHNKYVSRPAMQKRKKRATKKKQKAESNKLSNLLKGLSPEEVQKILAAVKDN